MITAGCHVIIQKVGGEHIRVCDLKRKKSILIEKLRFCADGAIDQPYGLFETCKGKLSRVCEETPSTAKEQDSHEKSSTDAESKMETSSTEQNGTSCLLSEEDTRHDAQKRQKLTQDDICAMKSTGINTQELVAKLVDGNSAFSERSDYAKSKYIRRKARKHSDRVLILKPTIRLLIDSYYKKDPDRISNLRLDVLGQMLMLGGIQSGYKCVVIEQCLGLLTAAVIERLGGIGACIHVHRGLIAQGIPCVQSMGFDDKMYSTFLPLRASTLVNGSIEETEEKPEPTNQSEATMSRKADRLNRERLAWSMMSAQQVDIVFIAVKSVDPIDVLEHTWPSLRLAATVVLYSPLCEPLMKAFTWLRERGALHVQLSDSFQRYYQVLNESTHPVMQQLVAGGLILSAIKVVPPS